MAVNFRKSANCWYILLQSSQPRASDQEAALRALLGLSQRHPLRLAQRYSEERGREVHSMLIHGAPKNIH